MVHMSSLSFIHGCMYYTECSVNIYDIVYTLNMTMLKMKVHKKFVLPLDSMKVYTMMVAHLFMLLSRGADFSSVF